VRSAGPDLPARDSQQVTNHGVATVTPFQPEGATMPKPLEFSSTPTDWQEISLFIMRHAHDNRPALLKAAALGYNLAIYLNQQEQDT